MSKQKIKVSRLRKLSKHLRGENRAHKRFDFNEVCKGKLDKEGNYCGSAGCAIGEFPAVWPREWKWGNVYNFYGLVGVTVFCKGQRNKTETSFTKVSGFFSITQSQVEHLFTPFKQNSNKFGGERLYKNATAEQVADNIDAFIKKVS